MLYVSTRNNRDAFTANRAMRENRCPDGGHYLPFRHPSFTTETLDTLLSKSFGQCVADILNVLFNTKLTGWDVDFSIGRHPVHLEPLPHRILLAECWHTPGYRFSQLTKALHSRLLGDDSVPSGWMEIAVRTAILFGIFAELRRSGVYEADVACVSRDFITPISALYAKRWGLPVKKIVCCCNENNSIWDLICHGQMRTGTVSIPTILPAADVAVPDHLERLIYECGGMAETQRYLDVCRTGGSYCPSDSVLAKIREAMYVSVVSSQRILTTIPGVYRTHGRLLSTYSALTYAGLLDYRAKTSSARHTIVWSEEGPAAEAEMISNIMGVPESTVGELL